MANTRSVQRRALDDDAGRRQCESFLPEARRIEPRDIMVCRCDVNLALHNVVRGVDAVLVHEETIRSELPAVDIAKIRGMIALAQAVGYASRQVDRQAPSSKELRQLMARGRELRLVLLTAAESLAVVGILPTHIVSKIRAGKGDIDAAGDCVELAALFVKNAQAVRGKTTVTSALTKEAAEVGSRLLTLLKPRKSKAPKEVQAELRDARELRDRLFTLLVGRHDLLRRVGAYLFGVSALDKHVPPLQSAKRAPSKSKTASTGQASVQAKAVEKQ